MKTKTGKYGGRYYIVDEENDIAYPSVTTILGETTDKSGLDAWVKRVGEKEAERISRFSANRGTFMHVLHEKILDLVYEKGQKLSESYKEALFSTKKELKKENLTKQEEDCGLKLFTQFAGTDFYSNIQDVIFQERAVWAPFGGGYAGRLDLMIRDVSGKIKIIDFKSSRKPKQREWIENYFLQSSAYAIGAKNVFDIMADEVEIWISCESGEVQKFSLDRSEMKRYGKEFLQKTRQYHKIIEERNGNS